MARTSFFPCRGSGLIPGQGTKIPQALQYDLKKMIAHSMSGEGLPPVYR